MAEAAAQPRLAFGEWTLRTCHPLRRVWGPSTQVGEAAIDPSPHHPVWPIGVDSFAYARHRLRKPEQGAQWVITDWQT
jgi:hypothetical protein